MVGVDQTTFDLFLWVCERSLLGFCAFVFVFAWFWVNCCVDFVRCVLILVLVIVVFAGLLVLSVLSLIVWLVRL